jgi:hypothetical protein
MNEKAHIEPAVPAGKTRPAMRVNFAREFSLIRREFVRYSWHGHSVGLIDFPKPKARKHNIL